MSAARGQTSPMRSERTPLRDVQNEMVAGQQQKSPGTSLWKTTPQDETENWTPLSAPKSDCSIITSVCPSDCRTENEPGNITYKSFLCAGGEIEISEGSEESILIRALTLDDGPQTLNNTTVTCDEDTETVLPSGEHSDHPYCSYPSEEPNSEPEGVTETSAHADFPSSETESPKSVQAEITFKSFTCPGGEIEVADRSIMQDDSVISGVEDQSESDSEHTQLLVSPCHHMDHPYCRYEMECSASGGDECTRSAISDAPVNRSCLNISSALGQLLQEQGDAILRSLSFSEAEVEIVYTHDMSELSMLLKNLVLGDHHQSFSGFSEIDGETTATLSSGGEHADHLYCRVDLGDNDGLNNSQCSSTGVQENSGNVEAFLLDSLGGSAALTSGLESVVESSLSEEPVDQSDQSQMSSLHHSATVGPDVKVDPSQCLDDQFISQNKDKEAPEGSAALTQDSAEVQAEIHQTLSDFFENPTLICSGAEPERSSESIRSVNEHSQRQDISNQEDLSKNENTGSDDCPAVYLCDLVNPECSEVFQSSENEGDASISAGNSDHCNETKLEISEAGQDNINQQSVTENQAEQLVDVADQSQNRSSLLHHDLKVASETSREVFACRGDQLSTSKNEETHLSASGESFARGSAEVSSDQAVGRSSSEKNKSVLDVGESAKSSCFQAEDAESGRAQSMLLQNMESEHDGIDNVQRQPLLPLRCREDEEENSERGREGVSQNVQAQRSGLPRLSGTNLVARCGDDHGNVLVRDTDVEKEVSGVTDNSASEVLRAESVHEAPAHYGPLQDLWSALTLQEPSTPRNSVLSRSVLQGYTEGNPESRLWPELPESPLPPPQLNSTALPQTPVLAPSRPRTDSEVRAAVKGKEKALVDFSSLGKGPLQQQLRQMAELLILASGKITAPSSPAPGRRRTAGVGTTPVGRHSVATITTPAPRVDRSANTSALVEEVKEAEVSDACTSTDSLLWSVSPSSLQGLSRSELEQKLLSTLIMVEVLSQQLSSTQSRPSGPGPAPSELRNKLVQTDHTQLRQMGPYRELYVSALERIRTLEEDEETLRSLHHAMQKIRTTMSGVKTDTEGALWSMRQIESIVNEDQEIRFKQESMMKALYGRCMVTLRKMEEKCQACLQERDRMKQRVEEALQEKETVLRVLEQLRVHHSEQVSELQRSLGSQQGLTAALTHTVPQLVQLNRAYVESLSAASTLLREKLDDHEHLSAELQKAQQLLQKTNPVLQKLQQRASAATEQSQLHQAQRDRAMEEKAQMEVELEQAQSSLQAAEQHIADLNTQITIMNSEMSVLREQLGEVEEDRAHLQRQSTELSATVSSTLASYAFLEQALASETSKLQRSLHETQEAAERADSLQASVEMFQQRVEELEKVLAQRDALLTALNIEAENQRLQLRRLTQIQAELSSAREMSEFLQAENELTREQLAESEGLLRSHLQGLRERNLQCEDLRLTLEQLRAERDSLQEEMESTRDKARVMLLEQGELLARATVDVSLLQHRVQSLTRNTHTVQGVESGQDEPPQLPRPPCSSFVSSIMKALTEEPPADPEGPAQEDEPLEGISSKSSAFAPFPPTAPQQADEQTGRTTLVEMLASLADGVSELQSAVEQLNQQKESEMKSLKSNICGLQEALQAESKRHSVEEADLRQQVGRLKARAEKDAQVLQQKTEDEKALRKLCAELEENIEAAQKHRAENNELRREGAELRWALQQSQVEIQALRAEVTRSGDQSAAVAKDLDDRIRLLREVEKLKAKLMEVEESRAKLLERAKRHQMVHNMNQSKLERELHLLDDMIEAVRKALSSVPDVVENCPELRKLVEFLG